MSDDRVLVLIVRRDLEMTAPKVAAQCVHAATNLVAHLAADEATRTQTVRFVDDLERRALILRVKSETQMNNAIADLEDAGLRYSVQTDAGLNEIPANTRTVVAVEPTTQDALPRYVARLQALKG